MDLPLHDESISIPVSSEVVVKTRRRIKNPNPKWYKHLLVCLDKGRHDHMLSYIDPDKKKFKIVFTDKKNKKKWRKVDISLFKDLDKHIGNVFNRPRSEKKFDEEVKIRFKSNISKCMKRKFIKEIGKNATEKGKTEKIYEILWRPDVSVGESSSDGRMSKNKNFGKSSKKSYKKNDSKKNNLSRNFQEKTASIGSVPQMDSYEKLNFAIIPQVGNHENKIFTAIPQIGHQENMIFTTNPQVGNHENMIFMAIPEDGRQGNMNFMPNPQVGNHENTIFTTNPQVGNYKNVIFTTNPQVGNHENVNIESTFQMGNHEIKKFESMFVEDNEKNEIGVLENLIFINQGEIEKNFENVHQGDNSVGIPQHTYEEKHSHYLCVSADSQIQNYGGERDNSGVSLENLFPMNCDSNIYETSMDDKGKKICENSDVMTNMRMEEISLDMINDGVFENQGNSCSLNNGKYVVEEDGYLEKSGCLSLQPDPYLCDGQFQSDFSPLGEFGDWPCSYLPLSNMEADWKL